ncbi:MAG: NAD+ synthase [Actinobacteria bacterium]|nr:NAD+ synthase [Actinomycetota bacterium]MCL6104961.1 NAD+ synthase [Actinomycetota bacterium]
MREIRLGLCQIDVTVGDLNANTKQILHWLDKAEQALCDIAIFPELAVVGYPPEDLLLKEGFIDDTRLALEKIAQETGDCVAIVGSIQEAEITQQIKQGDAVPRRLYNTASVCSMGKVVGHYHKHLLPNYSVFDERRYFLSSQQTRQVGPPLFSIGGTAVGISICEDLWSADGPVSQEASAGAKLIVNINASPYYAGRIAERLAMLKNQALRWNIPIAYVNLVGGQDELVFDGGSMVVGENGELLASAQQFQEDLLIVDMTFPWPGKGQDNDTKVTAQPSRTQSSRTGEVIKVTDNLREKTKSYPKRIIKPLGINEEIYHALVLGTRDYVWKNGFKDVVIGLSGGIDSSLVATVAVDALGKEHVHGVTMPSIYTSETSINDAVVLSKNLGIDLLEISIQSMHEIMSKTVGAALGKLPVGTTDENIQSRLRGIILMALSNARGWLVLTTSNKSELAVGYSTLYGDSAGGFCVIKDVPKTTVYQLCKMINAKGVRIPVSILHKPPSAELKPNQRDDQTLPPYEKLDPILFAYVEQDMTVSSIVSAGFDAELTSKITKMVDSNEYKRRQMPPGVRVTPKAFGKDRRMPITNRYTENRYIKHDN